MAGWQLGGLVRDRMQLGSSKRGGDRAIAALRLAGRHTHSQMYMQ